MAERSGNQSSEFGRVMQGRCCLSHKCETDESSFQFVTCQRQSAPGVSVGKDLMPSLTWEPLAPPFSILTMGTIGISLKLSSRHRQRPLGQMACLSRESFNSKMDGFGC